MDYVWSKKENEGPLPEKVVDHGSPKGMLDLTLRQRVVYAVDHTFESFGYDFIPHSFRYFVIFATITSPIWLVAFMIIMGEVDSTDKKKRKL